MIKVAPVLAVLLASAGTAMTAPIQSTDGAKKAKAEEAVVKSEMSRVVRSGKIYTLHFTTVLNPDCSLPGETEAVVTQKPDHGTVETVSAEGFVSYKPDNLRAHCNSKKVRGVNINYKSSPGYVGVDDFEVTIFAPTGWAQEIHFTVSVR